MDGYNRHVHYITVMLSLLFYEALQRRVEGHEEYKCIKTIRDKYFKVCNHSTCTDCNTSYIFKIIHPIQH